MNVPIFKEDEIPYAALEYIGLTKDMIEDLPEREKSRLLAGLPTSPLTLRICVDGKALRETRASIYLRRVEEKDSEGQTISRVAHVSVAQRGALDLSQYPESIRSMLGEGHLVFAKTPLNNIAKGPGFYQVDRVLNCVAFLPSETIRHNLLQIVEKENLSNGEIATLVSGRLVTRYDANNTNPVTFGISLSEDTGVKVINGDKVSWRNSIKEENESLHFGVSGCWQRMEDGALSYTPSDQYSDELQEAMKENNDNVLGR